MRVVSLESRRREDMARLIRRHGGLAIEAPSMQEAPLAVQTEAVAFGDVLLSGGCDVLILLTGVGTRMLVDAMATRRPRDQLLEQLGSIELICRGPKPVAFLKTLNLRPTAVAPEPNTWRELLEVVDQGSSIADKNVYVQEYGVRNDELLQALEQRGAHVTPVPIYAWIMPDDTAPLRRAVTELADAAADAVLFTSRQQVEHLMQLAVEMGRDQDLVAALKSQVVVASIGPITSDTLMSHGITPDLHPPHPKMGQLVTTLMREGPAVLERKRGG